MKLKKLSLSIITVLHAGLTTNALAQDNTQESATGDQLEVIEVKGFRSSLNKSLLTKRANVNSMESISAEDIGKFPDLNLAESLQRISGVSISREGGEGRRITLRGLGPDFTRATLNGMEIPAETDQLDSSISALSGGRAFDFNVFASELFNRVDVQKSPTASMEEGGIAGSVNLYTAKPFDNPGFHYAGSAQANYNDVSEETNPRTAVMVSNTFDDDKFGVLFSLAYSTRNVNQQGFGTVGWQTPVNNNMTYADTSSTNISGSPSGADCQLNGADVDAINCLYAPRIPRPDYFGNEQTRLGITSSFQYAPSDNVLLTFDYLHSQLENERSYYHMYAMFRNYFNQITPTSVTVAPNGQQIIAGEFDGITNRVESRETTSDTAFNQYVLSGEFGLTDRLIVDAMVGYAEIDFSRDEFRHIMDSTEPHSFGFDFTGNPNAALLDFQFDYNDPALYNLSSYDLQDQTDKENLTAKFDGKYVADMVEVKAGVAYNNRKVSRQYFGLPTFSTGSAEGLTEMLPISNFGDGFDGNLFPFVVADFDAVKDAIGPLNWQSQDQKNTQVEEETMAVYLEFNTDFDIADMILRTNFGMRYVDTTATSTGYIRLENSVETIVAEHDYKNFLPALNLALEPADDLIVRLGLTRSMTRPSLNTLNPGNPAFRYIEGFVTVGNPYLDPYVSNNVDFGVEWYFDEESLLSATLFYKDIETYIRSTQEEKLVDSIYYTAINNDPVYDPAITVNPFNEPYTHYSYDNGDGTTINGFEISYQQPFNFLPAPFDNFGTVANYTRVSSGEIVGVSENSYNFTLYYETEKYGARLSANSRDDYFIEVPGITGNAENGVTGPTNIDFSSFYNWSDNLTFSFEVINLTDEYSRLFVTGDGSLDMVREYNNTGRQFFLGVRYHN